MKNENKRTMKKMKYLLLLAACTVATGSMTSCLNSDDNDFDSSFTEEELNTYLTKLSGTYLGKLMFYHRGQTKNGLRDSMMLDSIENVTWMIRRDSTIVIDNFPDSIYNNAVTGNSDFRKVLAGAPSQTITCRYSPYKGRTQSNTVDYGFIALPDGTVKNNAVYVENKFTDEDNTREYNVEYGYVTYYSNGYNTYYQSNGYLSSTYNIDFMLIMKDVQCAGVQSFTTEVYPILLKGVKMW